MRIRNDAIRDWDLQLAERATCLPPEFGGCRTLLQLQEEVSLACNKFFIGRGMPLMLSMREAIQMDMAERQGIRNAAANQDN